MLSVGRLETVKRVDLAIRAMAHAPADALARHRRHRHAARSRSRRWPRRSALADRVRFLGEVDDDDLIELYAGALGVVFPPYDEDYGYVTLEAFLAHKPVVTTTDAGGPNEFVDRRRQRLRHRARSGGARRGDRPPRTPIARAPRRMGDAGYERARTITWAGVIERLVGWRPR